MPQTILGRFDMAQGIHKPSTETTPRSNGTEKKGNTLGCALLHADTRTVRKQDCIRKNKNSLFSTIFLKERHQNDFFSGNTKSQIFTDCVEQ